MHKERLYVLKAFTMECNIMTEKGLSTWQILDALDLLCKSNPKCAAKLRSFLSKQIWSPVDRQSLMEKLTELFLNPKCTEDVCISFRPFILDVAERTKSAVLKQGHSNNRLLKKFAVALSQGIHINPDLRRFAIEYINTFKPFSVEQDDEPKKKKAKKEEKVSDAELSEAMWRYVSYLGDDVGEAISLKTVAGHMSHDKPEVRWFGALTVAHILQMSCEQQDNFIRKYFTPEEIREMSVRQFFNEEWQRKLCSPSSELISRVDTDKALSYTMQCLVNSDLSDSVVDVAGVLLPKISTNTAVETPRCLIPVPSMWNNLRSLALAVASGSPVLLQGPVGSGKTSLVEHLAVVTGRDKSPHLLKIQLGDQTDSKALLGTYRCTEVPGEFIWQPGILTQAVTEGLWVLLEDVDYAPMDVVSVLLPLLENGTLSVPGHGDNVRAHPGFRLFATQRLLSSSTGWHLQQSSNSVLLEKMWTKIHVEPLSRLELQQVIVTKYPKLNTVVEKLLDIYFLLSAGKHELGLDDSAEDCMSETVGRFLSLDGRLVSTRDLMTWCSRISTSFDISSANSGSKVFQEAVDCFVSCLSKPSKRLPLAEAIGAKLNITKAKVEYFCVKHKPNVDISSTSFSVGRAMLPRKAAEILKLQRSTSVTFAFTRQSVSLLERVAICVARNEPVLLVGETGTGKTSSVQFLAQQLGQNLQVINMNQQSDSTDLLGGFKPVDLKFVIMPFREEFEILFCQTFSRKQNAKFLGHLQECFAKRRWADLLSLMDHTQQAACNKYEKGSDLYSKWQHIGRRLRQLKIQVQQIENALAFSFIEGTLVRALQRGDWVLLDEINLAAAETLECLGGLLESTVGSVILTERGDLEPVVRHENFRLFACMNPATDVGKKDLTPGIRNRFTELFVDELNDVQDLKILVSDYLKALSLTSDQIDEIVKFYLKVREEAVKHLTDGTGHRPYFSLRTLCRALMFAAPNPCGVVARSLYEGFCLSFLTQLDRSSHPAVERLVCQYVVSKANLKSVLKRPLPRPLGGNCLNFEGYWVSVGSLTPRVAENYILTPSVRANLRDLCRIVSASNHPVLIQGETSVGKTSLITWLAQTSGNQCMRVNNHEHTDLQEYIGCYAADEAGKLVFKEGVLVEAMRKGYWIILDELNLAPSDVLEALNRLLDDNRELFIAETQEIVKAHPKFMLFATQNPPGHYGGRKMMSRAFRNRFVELHFDEIPSKELETILHQRCSIPLSYAKRLVAVMLELQTRRRGSGVFAGKQGFMTLRDLFRWAERYRITCSQISSTFYDWDQHLADHGYMLLAGRVRKPEETGIVQQVIQKHMKRSVDPERLFSLSAETSLTTAAMLKEVIHQSVEGFQHIVWTHSMMRLAVLIGQAIQFNEPILLVGETGCGKTTMCQLYAALKKTELFSVNCHLHTESADFLGGLRPVRSHSSQEAKDHKLFEWVDGPLILAMKEGCMFLIDEISLADDSVLERLNSVLEPERTLLLAEKGGGDGEQNDVELVVAHRDFHVFATMNPGGDFGKKELSPALRNRFTEIWCPQSNGRQDLIDIIEHNLKRGLHLCNQQDGNTGFGTAIMDFIEWFSNNEIGKRCTVSIRDILSWVNFLNTCATCQTGGDDMEMNEGCLEPAVAYVHGACLVFLDSLGAGVTWRGSDFDAELARDTCVDFLMKQVNSITGHKYSVTDLYLACRNDAAREITVNVSEEDFTVAPFSIQRGSVSCKCNDKYAFQAPATCMNAQRILRALQLPRPLLLEGSPGVGKTSLVTAIAKASGRELVRINLSEQTDVTDLFGADLPVEGSEGGMFAWRDGPLLQALRSGHWVVFDELNLASQSVLEGLNACLDHRAEIYIPELGKTFCIQHEKTRLFACQNPLNQGGGRKGLPRSFLNRFTQVYVEALSRGDLLFIVRTAYPTIPEILLAKMVDFNMTMYEETMIKYLWGRKGGPWEFNLRDLFRWCDVLLANQVKEHLNPGEYVGLIYKDRMRTVEDKRKVMALYQKQFHEVLVVSSTEAQVSGMQTKEAQISGIQTKEAQISGIQTNEAQVSGIQTNEAQVSGIQTNEAQFSDILTNEAQISKEITPCLWVGSSFVQVGHSFLPRIQHNVPGVRRVCLQILHHHLQQLESLMKCVEMNWLAIMVGPQSCGKTSIIHLLSELTGNTLHILPMNSAMDTTELLGGFEQSDVSRHVEEIAVETEKMVRNCQCDLLTHGKISSSASAQTIDDEWNSYRQLLDGDGQKSAVEEHELLCDKMTALASVLILLGKVQKQTNPHLKGDVQKLSTKLRLLRDGCANPATGDGKFEWVNSLLVKALQAGHWLLIDNVNFCSPSVLDRLNALLEPGGVLSINERGVIDGSIPTIKPHPNFRLFLAMDPKFGEISRAMRNRGVEIYMPGEEDGSIYSSSDMKRMLKGLGLSRKVVCDWLIHLHGEMKKRLPQNEQPVVVDLLCAGQMVVQQVERGMPYASALYYAGNDVYVRSLKTVATKKVAKQVLQENLKTWDIEERDKTDVDLELGLWPFGLPDTKDFQNVSLAQTKIRTGVITFIIDGIHQELLWEDEEEALTRISSEKISQLIAAVRLLLSQVSERDRQFVSHWFQTFMKERLSQVQKLPASIGCQGWTLGGFVGSLSEVVSDNLSTMFQHPLMNQWREIMNSLCSGHDSALILLTDQPWDLAWNTYFINKVCFLHGGFDTSFEQLHSRLFSTLNKLYVLQSVSLVLTLQKPLLEKLEEISSRAKSSRSVDLTAQLHLHNMFKELGHCLIELVERLEEVTEQGLYKIWNCLPWMSRLLQVTRQWQQVSTPVFMSQLSLHWNWFNNKTLPLFFGHTSGGMSKLQAVLSHVQKLLGQDSQAAKHFVKFWEAWGHPQAFVSESEAKLAETNVKLVAAVCVYNDAPLLVVRNKVKVVVSQGFKFRAQLVSLMKEGESDGEKANMIAEKQEAIKKCIAAFGLLTLSDSDMEITETATEWNAAGREISPSGYVELWPLFEHLGLLAEFTILAGVSRHIISFLPKMLDYSLMYTPDIPAHLADLVKANSGHVQEEAKYCIVSVLRRVMRKLWVSTCVKNSWLWLEWDQETDAEKDAVDINQGPGMLQLAPVSFFTFTLLSTDHDKRKAGLFPMEVPLGSFGQQLDKLSLMSSHLWCHAAILANPKLSIKNLEVKYLFSSFLHLLESLNSIVDIQNNDQWLRMLDVLQTQLSEDAVDRDTLLQVHNCFQSISKCLEDSIRCVVSRCFEIVEDLVGEKEKLRFLDIGHGLVYCGLGHVLLLAPKGPVDPVEKRTVKLEHCKTELADVKAELAVRNMYTRMISGKGLLEMDISDMHPRTRYLLRRKKMLEKQKASLESQQVYRPEPSQYLSLVQDISHYLGNVGSIQHVTGLLSKLLSASQMLAEGREDITMTGTIQEEKVWQRTQHKFVERMETEYPCYMDLLQPFMVSVYQLSMGMRIIAQSVDISRRKLQINNELSPEAVVTCLAQFPFISETYPSILHMAQGLVSERMFQIVRSIQGQQNKDRDDQTHTNFNSKLLLVSLLLIKNHSLVSRELSPDLTFTVSRILQQFVSVWQDQEELKREREEEKESLYRYKSKVHGDERSEEEREEEEFKLSFPTFEKEFADVTEAKTLEETGTVSEVMEDDEEGVLDNITENEMLDIYRIHSLIFTSLTSSNWIGPSQIPKVLPDDHVRPAIVSYKLAASLGRMTRDCLENHVDSEVLGGHLLVSGAVQTSVRSVAPDTPSNHFEDDLLAPLQSQFYDVYWESNVSEVIQCRPVLERFSTRVTELQTDYPDHPTLRQLQLIIQRILSFPVLDPVMKFLTGLELLLEKAQDWEANAAHHVSLLDQTMEVTTVIIQWRKLELSCWSNSLDVELRKCQQKVCRWWFHIYQLIVSFLSSGTDDTSVSLGKDDLLTALKQFLENSTLGEFGSRLQLVYTFHCQTVNMDPSQKQGVILNMLWNVYQFYHQFLSSVESEIVRQRTPIEKELKGFVRIARWNDMNYWALKQTTEKTHRTIHKQTKAFQAVLQHPVRPLLVEKGDNLIPTHGEVDGFVTKLEEFTSSALKQAKEQQRIVFPDLPLSLFKTPSLQSRLPTLSSRLSKHWQTVITSTRYTWLISSLDEFTGDIIAGVHELRAAELPQQGVDKEKQRSEAKLLNLRKRKALSDLFRHLTHLGLSYRKGLATVGGGEGSEALFCQPLDVEAALMSHAETTGLPFLFDGYMKYYYRCLARESQLRMALVTPSRELGVGNIDRCRGFSQHLMVLLIKQHSHLADFFTGYLQIQKYMNVLHQLHVSQTTVLPPQTQVNEWIVRLKSLTVQLLEGLGQFQILLYTCPRHQDTSVYPSPFPQDHLSTMALVCQGDEIWCYMVHTVKDLIAQLEIEHLKILKAAESICHDWKTFESLQNCISVYEKLVPDLENISQHFNDPEANTGCCLNMTLTFLAREMAKCCESFRTWSNTNRESVKLFETNSTDSEVLSDEARDISEKTENVVATLLLGIQNLLKHHEKMGEIPAVKDEGEDEVSDLKEGHLAKLLFEEMNQDVKELQSEKVINSLNSLMKKMAEISSAGQDQSSLKENSICLKLLLRCYPILHQYTQIVEFFVGHLIGLHRTSGKLLSVLLGIFTELASKGFCVPPEFSDEVDGEGATEFADIEGGGIGEGEGVKDVSDQIETEDQLDEARRPNEERKDEDERSVIPDEDNAIEMSEDFEGKMEDLEPAAEGESGSDDSEDQEEDLDKQMGEVDMKDADKLDEQLWGSDDEDMPENEDSKEESGPGAGEQSEKQLVAKDDNQDKSESDDRKNSQKDESTDKDNENNEEQKPHDLDEFNEEEYDVDKIDQYHGKQGPEPEPEAIDLPDDLNLDNDEKGNEEEDLATDADNKGPDGVDEEMKKDEEAKGDGEKDEIENEDEPPTDKEDNQEEETETEDRADERKDENAKDEEERDTGFTPQDEDKRDDLVPETELDQFEDKTEGAKDSGKTVHDASDAEKSEVARDEAATGESEQQEREGQGVSSCDQQDGHEGQSSSQVMQGSDSNKRKKKQDRHPGHSSEERSLGSADQSYKKLKTVDQTSQESNEGGQDSCSEANLHEHIKDSKSCHDAQTLDVATAEQQEQQPILNMEVEEEVDPLEEDDEIKLKEDKQQEEIEKVEMKEGSKLKTAQKDGQDIGEGEEEMEIDEGQKHEIAGENVVTMGVGRGPESTIHTALEHLHLGSFDGGLDIEKLRAELEDNVLMWSHQEVDTPEAMAAATEAWQQYDAVTARLSQELCEQLRLILEPTQATKLKGDYRTGKRLNMKKVIPYIASQFRKDKIWLRRMKPSKRQYQIMMAIDDSSSMVDNHSKQLAFESLALISNALTLLESGELSICSFGETVQVHHPFSKQFSSQSGASILQHFTFEQKKTKIAQLLNQATSIMVDARRKQHGRVGHPETSQLLLIVSDGRGLFMEGMEVVKTAVRQAREANIFLVFVILDNPKNKDSILDIKVPVFKGSGQLPEIQSYMEHFPFPFYVILRDTNSLPQTLSDALRQWFELVTAGDR